MSIFAGLDVSDKSTHVCLVDERARCLKRDVWPAIPT